MRKFLFKQLRRDHPPSARTCGSTNRVSQVLFPPFLGLRGKVGNGPLGRRTSASLWRSRLSEGLVHDPPDGTGATPAFGAASQAPVDLAGRPDHALRRNGPDLMVRNDVARTHDHEGTPGSIRYLMICARCERGAPDDGLSLPFGDDVL